MLPRPLPQAERNRALRLARAKRDLRAVESGGFQQQARALGIWQGLGAARELGQINCPERLEALRGYASRLARLDEFAAGF